MILYVGQRKTDILERVFAANHGDPYTAFLFFFLIKRVNKNNMQCWPSLAKLVKDTGFNKKTIIKGLKTLKEQGFISRIDGKSVGYRSFVTKINL